MLENKAYVNNCIIAFLSIFIKSVNNSGAHGK